MRSSGSSAEKRLRALEETLRPEEGPCPECGCNPSDPKLDKHEALFVHQVEEDLATEEPDYVPPEYGQEYVCPECGTGTDTWLIHDDGMVWFLIRRRGQILPESHEDDF